MDAVYMFVFRHLKWFFAGICVAMTLEGIFFAFFPKKITRWLENMPKKRMRFVGAGEIILALVILYLVLYGKSN